MYINQIQMVRDNPQHQILSTQWLFNPRLQFLGPQFDLSKRKSQHKIPQNSFTHALLHKYTLIKSQQDIEEILILLNNLLNNFCLYDEANQKTPKGVKGQGTKKKNAKQVEKQSNRVKRFLELFKIDEKEEQEWNKILKFRNVTSLLSKIYQIFFYILQQNFELVERIVESSQSNRSVFQYQLSGFASLKNKQLPQELQFSICILVLDTIRLIKTIRLAYMPYSEQQLKKMSDEVQQFDKHFNEIKEPNNFASMYKSFKNPTQEVFIQLLKQKHSKLSPQYKLWLDIYEIKQNYLIDETNHLLLKNTYKSKLQSTVVKELQLYWLFVSNQYQNNNFNRKDVQQISLQNVFEDYKYLFGHLVDQVVNNQAKMQEILNFFNLINGPWKSLDFDSSLRFFWKCIIKVNEKIKLPSQYLFKNLDLFNQVFHSKINSFRQQRNQQIKGQFQHILLSLSLQLIQLSEDKNFKRDYLQNNKNRISEVLSKFNQYQGIADQCKREIKEINQSNIFFYLNQIQKKLNQEITNAPKLAHEEQQSIFVKIQNIFQTDKDLVDEIRYFMAMANNNNLKECGEFYGKKIQRFMNRGRAEAEGNSKMPFGIVSSLRVAIFGLITTIKLQENPQVHQVQGSLKQQRLQKLIQKLLKFFHQKNKYLKRENHLNYSQQHQDNELSLPIMRRISSFQLDQSEFQIEQQLVESVERESQNQHFEDNQFRLKLLKIIFEIKIDMINKKVIQLDDLEKPLRNQFQFIKKRLYDHSSKDFDFQNKEDIEILPKIEYELTRKRFWPALRKLANISKANLPEIQNMLSVSWGNQNNILRYYVALLLKYRERQSQTNEIFEMTPEQQKIKIVNSVLQHHKLESKEKKKLKEDLLSSINILQNFQQVSLLRKSQKQQMQKIKFIQQTKKSEKVHNDDSSCFNKWLDGKLSIVQIRKHGIPITKKYTITPSAQQYENVLKKLQKLTKLNKYITLAKEKKEIYLHVDQHQLQFQSYPKLVKYLIKSYYQTVQFCRNNLQFQLYPLLWSKHITIGKVKENHPTLRFNPYQGIILNLLLTANDLRRTNLYQYPQFPFVEFAEQINRLFMHSKLKIYSLQNQNAEYHAFVNLIEQMKSLSLEQPDGNLQETLKNILKCPYFWSTTQKFFELVQFKQKYHSNVNIEQSRRKQNEKVKSELQKTNSQQYQNLMDYLHQKQKKQKHPHYKSMSGFNRTTQIYLSIQGLIQKQAFEEDIGNFREKNAKGQLKYQEYKYHAYWWIKNKEEIEYLLELVSQRQKKKGSKKSSVYEKTFNSFQNQIRNLRNLAVHYIYDKNNDKEINIEQKIRIFQHYFPKLFVFIYRWKPYIGKDYGVIQEEKINMLCKIFPNTQNTEVIQKLENIRELQEYNIANYKINRNETSTLLQEFKYDRGRDNDCYLCGLISMLLFKQPSFWGFLQNAKYPKMKEGKQVLYNVLFWDHKAVGCNGMQYLERAFYNVSQRNQFTSQELAEIKQSEIMLKFEKQRIQRKIQKLRNHQEVSSDQQDKQYKPSKESVQVRYHKLKEDEKDELHQELALTDYVPKYFIFQLQMRFPYLFHDLRRFRYLWDRRAKQLPTSVI